MGTNELHNRLVQAVKYFNHDDCDKIVNAIWPMIDAAIWTARKEVYDDLSIDASRRIADLEAQIAMYRRDPTLALATKVLPFKVVFENG